MRNFTFVVFILLMLEACSTDEQKPAQRISSYIDMTGQSLEKRIVDVPEVLLAELQRMDDSPNYTSHSLTTDEHTTAIRALNQLPRPLKSVLEANVNDICFVNNFKGAGMTYKIWNPTQQRYLMIFNPQVLTTSISDWLTIRDHSAFVPSGTGLKPVEKAPLNRPEFLHVLLHESSHVFDYKFGVTKGFQIAAKATTGFGSAIWRTGSDLEPHVEFVHRKDLHFYDVDNDPKVAPQELDSIAHSFETSPFASLYGSQTAMEDFAEIIAYGYLKTVFESPIELQIVNGSDIVFRYTPMSSEKVLARFQQAREILEGSLQK